MKSLRQQEIPYVSLFTGAMGLDIGLERGGFKAIVCNEIDPACAATISTNRPKIPIVTESIENIDIAYLRKVAGRKIHREDLVAGGPPCQSFSTFGRRSGVLDWRGKLIYEFVRLIDEIQPKVFLMENVRGLHSMPIIPKSYKKNEPNISVEHTQKGSLLREIIKRFEDIGYRVDCYLVNAVNYGAPQIRERLICIGNRYNLISSFPQPQYSNRQADCLPPFKTLKEAIGEEFVDPDPTLMNFSPRKLHYLSMVPPGGNWRSLPEDIQKESMGKSWYLKGGRSATWRKLSWDFPSPTVVTMPNHASTSMCHPSELRALTVGECASIQEFPQDWAFSGTPAEKYRQVGNAVPTRLGLVAGNVIKELLVEIYYNKGKKKKGDIPSRIEHIRPHVRTRCYWRNGKVYSGNRCYYASEEDEKQYKMFK